MEQKKTLVIIDVQKDFYDPQGALYVPGGEKVIPVIKKYIEDNKASIEDIIFTQDWHPSNHCSFKENGGQWPVHCVEYTEGASLPMDLIAEATKFGYKVAQKGRDKDEEEYGAFGEIVVFHWVNGDVEIGDMVSDVKINTKDIVICGLALDYCVYETTKKLLKAGPEFKFSLLKDGCACIGGPEKEKEIYEALIRKGVNII